MATVVVLCVLALFQPHPPVCICALPATINCSHLARISSSTPLQIHLVSLQSSPDRTFQVIVLANRFVGLHLARVSNAVYATRNERAGG